MKQEVKRKVQKKGKQIQINSIVNETLEIDEFKKVHQDNINQRDNLNHQIELFEAEIRKLSEIKETKKDKELVEHLKRAQNILKREIMQTKLETMRKNIKQIKQDLLDFSPTIAELNTKESRKRMNYIG